MIKAELNYNPYLLETSVKFNGQAPRINSLVEKFQEGSLQKWVRRIPDIFYDEMNGYDFELEFSGTKRDFLEVVDAFRRKGVSDNLVHVFHKNELDGRYEKSRLIDVLIAWLEENENRNFDFSAFKKEHAGLFDSSYVYIIFQGNQLSTDSVENKDVSVEHVSSVDELKDTDLKNTPVLMYLSKDNIQYFQKNLRYFLERDDVDDTQLFFLIHPAIDAAKVERIIKDLGIKEPTIVSEVFDTAVKKYIEVYPVSEYIYSVVSLFNQITNELSARLEAESKACAIVNKEVHARIDQYEDILRKLKEAHHNFVNRDNIEVPVKWTRIQNELLLAINIWRKRKTKITDDYEAGLIADEFESDAKKYFTQFLEKIVSAASATKQDIDTVYETWYRNAEFDTDFQAESSGYSVPAFSEELVIAEALKKIFEEEYVQPKEDIFGLFFKTSSDTQKEPVLQRTYYYQNWRDYVAEVVSQKAKEVVRNLFECMQKYETELSKSYVAHLSDLIEEQTQLKNQEAAKLSDEERLLQNDIDWLMKVQDQLKVIERG